MKKPRRRPRRREFNGILRGLRNNPELIVPSPSSSVQISSGIAVGSPILVYRKTRRSVHWTYDTWAYGHGVARAVAEQGAKSVYFIIADYAFGYDLEKQFADELVEQSSDSRASSSVASRPGQVEAGPGRCVTQRMPASGTRRPWPRPNFPRTCLKFLRILAEHDDSHSSTP